MGVVEPWHICVERIFYVVKKRRPDNTGPAVSPPEKAMHTESIKTLEKELAQAQKTIAELRNELQKTKALKKNETVLTATMEATKELVAAIDMEGRTIFANAACRDFFFKLYGHKLETRDIFWNVMPPEKETQWRRFLKKTQDRGGYQINQQYLFQNERIDIEWSASSIFADDGRTIAFTLSGRDITAHRINQRRLRDKEAQLHHAHKLEAVGNLAGGVANEFNNVLSIVLGNIELATMDIPKGHPGRPYIDEAKTGILRAKKVVRQLVDFSRKSSGQDQIADIRAIVVNALSLLRSAIPAHIEFHQHIDICPPVLADPSHIHQLIINLCTNAAEAMDHEGGVLTVTLEQAIFKPGRVPSDLVLTPGRYAKLMVADTGRGIEAECLERIYEPFFTTKDPDCGTGLGLAVVRSIVQSNAGAIFVRSRPGKGSKFVVYLPNTEQSFKSRPLADPALLTGNERILLVDDEPMFLMANQRQLQQLGYKVEIFTSPLKALERFRVAPDDFDLVISDVAMPKMTGDKFIVQIRQIRPEVPAILVTGYTEKVDEQTARLLACEYAIKPLERNQLASLVRKTLDHALTGQSDA